MNLSLYAVRGIFSNDLKITKFVAVPVLERPDACGHFPALTIEKALVASYLIKLIDFHFAVISKNSGSEKSF